MLHQVTEGLYVCPTSWLHSFLLELTRSSYCH